MTRGLILAVLLAALATLAPAGCARVAPVRFENPMVLSSADPVHVRRVAERIVMDLRFEIERPPAREGLITTEPLTSASWFEFWRKDTQGRMEVAEASLHTVRRRVVVTITPQGQGAKVLVHVLKDRLSAPNLGPANLGESVSLYSTKDTELERQNDLAATRYVWVDDGRDDVLEQYLFERIQLALASGGR